MSTIQAATKVLKVLKALRGHSLTGISLKDISSQLGESPSQTYRALQTLVDEGFATQLDDGSYVLGNALVAISHCHVEEIERMNSRISEHMQRVFASVKQIQGA